MNLLCIVIIIISGACVSECVHVCYIVLICAYSCLQCMCGRGVIWCTSGGSYVRYEMLSVGIDQLMLLASYLVHAGMVANMFTEIFCKGNLYA